jgi:hypothetical protein
MAIHTIIVVILLASHILGLCFVGLFIVITIIPITTIVAIPASLQLRNICRALVKTLIGVLDIMLLHHEV